MGLDQGGFNQGPNRGGFKPRSKSWLQSRGPNQRGGFDGPPPGMNRDESEGFDDKMNQGMAGRGGFQGQRGGFGRGGFDSSGFGPGGMGDRSDIGNYDQSGRGRGIDSSGRGRGGLDQGGRGRGFDPNGKGSGLLNHILPPDGRTRTSLVKEVEVVVTCVGRGFGPDRGRGRGRGGGPGGWWNNENVPDDRNPPDWTKGCNPTWQATRIDDVPPELTTGFLSHDKGGIPGLDLPQHSTDTEKDKGKPEDKPEKKVISKPASLSSNPDDKIDVKFGESSKLIIGPIGVPPSKDKFTLPEDDWYDDEDDNDKKDNDARNTEDNSDDSDKHEQKQQPIADQFEYNAGRSGFSVPPPSQPMGRGLMGPRLCGPPPGQGLLGAAPRPGLLGNAPTQGFPFRGPPPNSGFRGPPPGPPGGPPGPPGRDFQGGPPSRWNDNRFDRQGMENRPGRESHSPIMSISELLADESSMNDDSKDEPLVRDREPLDRRRPNWDDVGDNRSTGGRSDDSCNKDRWGPPQDRRGMPMGRDREPFGRDREPFSRDREPFSRDREPFSKDGEPFNREDHGPFGRDSRPPFSRDDRGDWGQHDRDFGRAPSDSFGRGRRDNFGRDGPDSHMEDRFGMPSRDKLFDKRRIDDSFDREPFSNDRYSLRGAFDRDSLRDDRESFGRDRRDFFDREDRLSFGRDDRPPFARDSFSNQSPSRPATYDYGHGSRDDRGSLYNVDMDLEREEMMRAEIMRERGLRQTREDNRGPNEMRGSPFGARPGSYPPPPMVEGRDRSPLCSRSPSRSITPKTGLRPPPPPSPKIEEKEPEVIGETVTIDDLISVPGRFMRPPKMVIILRGPPGSGKTTVAKMIKDREIENGGSPPRILSLDDYFMVETEKMVEDPDTGRKVKTKIMEYEYEPDLEDSYRLSLIKSFKKQVDDGFFPFIVIDCVNHRLDHFSEIVSYGKKNSFEVYIGGLEVDMATCMQRNVHSHSREHISRIISTWQPTPVSCTKVDLTAFAQDAAIEEVEMEDSITTPADEGTTGESKSDSKRTEEKKQEEEEDEEEDKESFLKVRGQGADFHNNGQGGSFGRGNFGRNTAGRGNFGWGAHNKSEFGPRGGWSDCGRGNDQDGQRNFGRGGRQDFTRDKAGHGDLGRGRGQDSFGRGGGRGEFSREGERMQFSKGSGQVNFGRGSNRGGFGRGMQQDDDVSFNRFDKNQGGRGNFNQRGAVHGGRGRGDFGRGAGGNLSFSSDRYSLSSEDYPKGGESFSMSGQEKVQKTEGDSRSVHSSEKEPSSVNISRTGTLQALEGFGLGRNNQGANFPRGGGRGSNMNSGRGGNNQGSNVASSGSGNNQNIGRGSNQAAGSSRASFGRGNNQVADENSSPANSAGIAGTLKALQGIGGQGKGSNLSDSKRTESETTQNVSNVGVKGHTFQGIPGRGRGAAIQRDSLDQENKNKANCSQDTGTKRDETLGPENSHNDVSSKEKGIIQSASPGSRIGTLQGLGRGITQESNPPGNFRGNSPRGRGGPQMHGMNRGGSNQGLKRGSHLKNDDNIDGCKATDAANKEKSQTGKIGKPQEANVSDNNSEQNVQSKAGNATAINTSASLASGTGKPSVPQDREKSASTLQQKGSQENKSGSLQDSKGMEISSKSDGESKGHKDGNSAPIGTNSGNVGGNAGRGSGNTGRGSGNTGRGGGSAGRGGSSVGLGGDSAGRGDGSGTQNTPQLGNSGRGAGSSNTGRGLLNQGGLLQNQFGRGAASWGGVGIGGGLLNMNQGNVSWGSLPNVNRGGRSQTPSYSYAFVGLLGRGFSGRGGQGFR
ncbi:uncharacterized protein LOC135212188 [Macrobrachium nipponense]|uniref:uncharacterized protein LOC135212188 n=1 Tax=Macrobrachium nipponense TaxID=159736 RepID=UPI0030C82869